MKKLEQVVTHITELIPQYEKSNTSISQANVGWHIAHIYLVINSIVAALKKSNPSEYQWKFSLPHLYVTLRGDFPRGKGKAPERVIPMGEINAEMLEELSAKTNHLIAEIPALDKNVYFKHPLFGLLNKKSTVRFLEIHTRHHYKIIRDIIG